MRAWLCVGSLEAYNKVTVAKDFILERNVFMASDWFNSSRYIEVNSSQCPLISLWNQLLSLGEGVISLAHSSYCKHSFFIPLGQSRSTNIRYPSLFSGSSYTLLILICVMLFSVFTDSDG